MARKPPSQMYYDEKDLPKTIDCWLCNGQNTMRLEVVMDFTAWYHCQCGNYECRRIKQDPHPEAATGPSQQTS